MPPRARDDLPWANGDLADVASAILRAQGERAMAVAPLVVDAVEKQSGRAQMRDADLALHLLLPEHANTKDTLAPTDLTREQRSSLERMARAKAPAGYRRYGLPENPTQLPMALIVEAVTHTGYDLTAYLDLADDTLALDPIANPPAALLATLPLVQRGRIDEKYDPLYTRVFRGNDKAVVAEFEKLLPTDVAACVKPKPKPR